MTTLAVIGAVLVLVFVLVGGIASLAAYATKKRGEADAVSERLKNLSDQARRSERTLEELEAMNNEELRRRAQSSW